MEYKKHVLQTLSIKTLNECMDQGRCFSVLGFEIDLNIDQRNEK